MVGKEHKAGNMQELDLEGEGNTRMHVYTHAHVFFHQVYLEEGLANQGFLFLPIIAM